MGRWAARRRTGGGPPLLNYITRAQIGGPTTVTLTYAADVAAASLDPANFESSPSGASGIGLAQATARVLTLETNDPVDTDSDITYGGSTPGFLTPQNVNYD